MCDLLDDLKERILKQCEEDNMNLVYYKYFVVTQKELAHVNDWTGGSKLFGYNLVLSEDKIPEGHINGSVPNNEG